MIIEELKSLVLNGPKIRDGGGSDLLNGPFRQELLLLGTVATQVERARSYTIS